MSPNPSDHRPPVLAAIFLPPDTSVRFANGRTKTFQYGTFIHSSIQPLQKGWNDTGGFNSIDEDPTYFEQNFRLSDSAGDPASGSIDKAEWAMRVVKAADQLREAGFTTMPVIQAPSVPVASTVRQITNEHG